MKPIACTILIALALTSCGPAGILTPTPVARTSNFSLKFQYDPCGPMQMLQPTNYGEPMYVLDTVKGTLVYLPLGETNSITIPFQQTDGELDAIYQKAAAIGFFQYASTFVIPAEHVIGMHTPAASYALTIANGALSHTVAWFDEDLVDQPYAPADRLRELMDLIEQTIKSHPEVQRLPPTAGCA